AVTLILRRVGGRTQAQQGESDRNCEGDDHGAHLECPRVAGAQGVRGCGSGGLVSGGGGGDGREDGESDRAADLDRGGRDARDEPGVLLADAGDGGQRGRHEGDPDAAPVGAWMRQAPPRLRSAKTHSGINGCALRASIRTKTSSPRTPTAMGPKVVMSAQPCSAARDKPKTKRPRPTVALAAPRRSKRADRRAATGMKRGASAATTRATGTLTKNTQRQPRELTSTPPRSRPAAAPSPSIAAKTPTARLRAAPAGKVETISDSAVACANAAAAPWRTRPATSMAGPEEGPPSVD